MASGIHSCARTASSECGTVTWNVIAHDTGKQHPNHSKIRTRWIGRAVRKKLPFHAQKRGYKRKSIIVLSMSGASKRGQDGGGYERIREHGGRREDSARELTSDNAVPAPAALVSDSSVAVLCDRHFACSLDSLLQGLERLHREQEVGEGEQPAGEGHSVQAVPVPVSDLEVVAR